MTTRACVAHLFFLCACVGIQKSLAFTPLRTKVPLHEKAGSLQPPLPTLSRKPVSRSGITSLCYARDKGPDGQEIFFLEKAKRKSRKQSGRAGGRRRRRVITLDSRGTKASLNVPMWANVVVPLLAAFFLLKSLFGGGSPSSDYVYYQSNFYESRVYGVDGRVETSRRESVQSNVPSLLEGKQLKDRASQYLLRESPDDEFDRALLDSMMQIQQSILDELVW